MDTERDGVRVPGHEARDNSQFFVFSTRPEADHLTLGVPYDTRPCEAALCYMNNVAFAHEVSELFKSSYHVGTFRDYDMEPVRRS